MSHRFIPKRVQRTGSFAPSRLWVRYNRLQSIDVGYIVPLYSISDIAVRYRLSVAAQRYFKKYILPEPYDIVRRRSTQAHHYSKFVLMALDVVLQDLEAHGHLRFLRSYTDHIELVHRGAKWMADFYEEKAEQDAIRVEDKYGVIWY